MSAPLLTTKLFVPPPRPNLVPRARLVARLDEGLRPGRRLTLLSAPAGFGKTTLLGAWIAGHDSPVAWLSLDADDDEPARFWRYVIAALQTLYPGLGRDALDLLTTAPPLPAHTILGALLNDIAALPRSPSLAPILLVLDDYHLIATPQIHAGLAFLLEHQPPTLHLVIATRADPPLPLSRLRARGQLTELRADDLRFSPGEAATFLNAVMGLDLAAGDVAALEARTEGWIAGLQLAALSLQGRADARRFIAAFSGSHHYVLEYLVEEVVRRQAEPVRRFLVQTSILDRLRGPLCDAVTGGDESHAMLADLHRRNLFLVPLDDEHRWYRYHHLFADLLRNLLRSELPPEQIRALHLRASVWFEQRGDPTDAIGHALRADDFKRAAGLIEAEAQNLIAHGRVATLLRWVEALPAGVLHHRPRLRLFHGWALSLAGRVDAAAQVLHETRTLLHGLAPSSEVEALRGQLAALLTGIATQREEPAVVIREAREALAHLPADDRLSRARVYVALGTAYAYENDAQAALHTWQEARDLALDAGNPFLATAAIEMLAGTQIYHAGQLRAAAASLHQVLELGTTSEGRRLPFTATTHALLAEIYLEWNDLDTAAGYLEHAIELFRQAGIGYGLVHTYCAAARLAWARQDPQAASAALHLAEEALAAHPMWHMVLHLAAYQVRLRLWLGDVEAAARWAWGEPATLRREVPDPLPNYLREVQRISRAWVHLARRETEQALLALAGLEERASATGRLAHAIEIALVTALARQAQGDAAAALEAFERAMSWAAPERYVRLFVEAGADVIPLLRHAAPAGAQPGYASRLLAAFDADAGTRAPAPQVPGAQSLPDPLTPREREVLALICDGLSNHEIATRLTVTLNTVKKHSSNIYGKLGVRSRTQAMVRAQELGLC
jgi:LuxR family maltose regulon positive regulatory protein